MRVCARNFQLCHLRWPTQSLPTVLVNVLRKASRFVGQSDAPEAAAVLDAIVDPLLASAEEVTLRKRARVWTVLCKWALRLAQFVVRGARVRASKWGLIVFSPSMCVCVSECTSVCCDVHVVRQPVQPQALEVAVEVA